MGIGYISEVIIFVMAENPAYVLVACLWKVNTLKQNLKKILGF